MDVGFSVSGAISKVDGATFIGAEVSASNSGSHRETRTNEIRAERDYLVVRLLINRDVLTGVCVLTGFIGDTLQIQGGCATPL